MPQFKCNFTVERKLSWRFKITALFEEIFIIRIISALLKESLKPKQPT